MISREACAAFGPTAIEGFGLDRFLVRVHAIVEFLLRIRAGEFQEDGGPLELGRREPRRGHPAPEGAGSQIAGRR